MRFAFDVAGGDADARMPDRGVRLGHGGLSVLEQILALDMFDNLTGALGSDGRPDFEGEEFVYFGDQANMPYGRYDSLGKTDFLRELIRRDPRICVQEPLTGLSGF